MADDNKKKTKSEKRMVWADLRRLFSRQSIVRSIGDKKLRVVDLSKLNKVAFMNTKLGGSYTGMMYNRYLLSGVSNEYGRFDRYRDYDTMEELPEISSALDLYAEESTMLTEEDHVININSDNENIKDILENLFFDVLDIDTNSILWFRNTTKYGDHLVLFDMHEKYGITGYHDINPFDFERVEGENNYAKNPNEVVFKIANLDDPLHNPDKMPIYRVAHFRLRTDTRYLPYGRCLHEKEYVNTEFGAKKIDSIKIGDKVWSFNQESNSMELVDVLNVVSNGVKDILRIRTKNNEIRCTDYHPILIYENGGLVYKLANELKRGDLLALSKNTHIQKSDNIILEPLTSIDRDEPSLVYDIQVSKNSNFIAGGFIVHNSMIESARKTWRQLSMLEDAMLVYRVSRSPERRVFKIDIGNMDEDVAKEYITEMANQFKGAISIDKVKGTIEYRFNPESVLEDFFIPVRGGNSATTIETLHGTEYTGVQDDIAYLKGKLYASLKIPKSYLGYEEDISGKTTLALEDIRFARTVRRIQSSIEAELTKVAIVHLFLHGYENNDLLNFSLSFNNPSTIHEQHKIELLQNKFTVYRDAKELLSTKWALEHILDISDGKEMGLILRQQYFDRVFQSKLDAIANVGAGMGGGAGGLGTPLGGMGSEFGGEPFGGPAITEPVPGEAPTEFDMELGAGPTPEPGATAGPGTMPKEVPESIDRSLGLDDDENELDSMSKKLSKTGKDAKYRPMSMASLVKSGLLPNKSATLILEGGGTGFDIKPTQEILKEKMRMIDEVSKRIEKVINDESTEKLQEEDQDESEVEI